MECDGGKDLGEEEEKYGGREGEKWACKRGSLRESKKRRERGKVLDRREGELEDYS